MPAMLHHGPAPAASPDSATVRRFARSSRALHWVHGGLYLALLASGLLIYVPQVKAVPFGSYRLVPLLHTLAGLVFIVAPALIVLVSRSRRALLRDVAAATTPARGDGGWLAWASLVTLGAKLRPPPVGKFNAGQKLNTVFWLLAYLWLGATGLVLAEYLLFRRLFDASLVEQVFPLHETVALLSIAPLLGHLYLSLVNRSTRPALRGIIHGDVPRAWAAEHHARWLAQTDPSAAVVRPIESD